MAQVLELDGTAYTTPADGEAPAVGDIVGIPDGRTSEVVAVVDGWVTVRPWDSDVRRDYRFADVYSWVEA
jgi:hypothetical protein